MKTLQLSFDWASQLHAWAWQNLETGTRDQGFVDANCNQFKDWFNSLRKRFPCHHIEIIVEMSKGPLISMLKDYPNVTIYPLSPAASAGFRKFCRPSGAKSDSGDAQLWLDYLQKNKDLLRPLALSTEQSRLLERLTRSRRDRVDDRTRCQLRIKACLQEYYPQAETFAGSLQSKMGIAFLTRWPDLCSLKKSGAKALERFYIKHRLRRGSCIERRLAELEVAEPLTRDRAIVEDGKLKLRSLVRELEVLTVSIEEFDQAIQDALDECDPNKVAVVESLPGAGKALTPRLYAILDLICSAAHTDAKDAANYLGVAPVRKSSGKSYNVFRRWARPKFPHQTMIEFANMSRHSSDWAAAYYNHRKNKGDSHWTILRKLAFKWLRIILRCWENDQPYDEVRYQQALLRRSSPFASSGPGP